MFIFISECHLWMEGGGCQATSSRLSQLRQEVSAGRLVLTSVTSCVCLCLWTLVWTNKYVSLPSTSMCICPLSLETVRHTSVHPDRCAQSHLNEPTTTSWQSALSWENQTKECHGCLSPHGTVWGRYFLHLNVRSLYANLFSSVPDRWILQRKTWTRACFLLAASKALKM